MRKALFSLLAIQAIVTLAIATGFFAYSGWWWASGALFGGGTGMAVSGLLALRLIRANRPGIGVGHLYLGALERFIFVGAAFAAGIAWLRLEPVALLAGFAGAELAYYVAASVYRGREEA